MIYLLANVALVVIDNLHLNYAVIISVGNLLLFLILERLNAQSALISFLLN